MPSAATKARALLRAPIVTLLGKSVLSLMRSLPASGSREAGCLSGKIVKERGVRWSWRNRQEQVCQMVADAANNALSKAEHMDILILLSRLVLRALSWSLSYRHRLHSLYGLISRPQGRLGAGISVQNLRLERTRRPFPSQLQEDAATRLTVTYKPARVCRSWRRAE